MKYDKYMDKECIELCDALNSLKGVRTFESCCGHFRKPYMIFMRISNWYSLSLLARAFDFRYSSGKWEIVVGGTDTPYKKVGIAVFTLQTNVIPKTEEEMNELINEAIENIEYWKQEKFVKYLKGEEL